jgi:hypothetical protein
MKISTTVAIVVSLIAIAVSVSGQTTTDDSTTQAAHHETTGAGHPNQNESTTAPRGMTTEDLHADHETTTVLVRPEVTTSGAVVHRNSWSVAVTIVAAVACLRLSI